MNKLLLTAALVTGVAGAVLAPRDASATDGSVSINGSLSAQTCKINGGSSPANFAVQLPTVSVSSLKTSGSVAGRTPFSITLTSCSTAGLVLSAFFEPGPTVMADGNLKNTGVAKNVEVQLLNASANVMNLSAAAGSQVSTTGLFNTSSTAGTGALTGAPLQYYAQYVATGAVGGGTVATSVQYTINYP